MKLMLPGGTGKPSREGIERVTETMPITFALPMIVFLFVQGVFDVVNELAPGIPFIKYVVLLAGIPLTLVVYNFAGVTAFYTPLESEFWTTTARWWAFLIGLWTFWTAQTMYLSVLFLAKISITWVHTLAGFVLAMFKRAVQGTPLEIVFDFSYAVFKQLADFMDVVEPIVETLGAGAKAAKGAGDAIKSVGSTIGKGITSVFR